MCSKSVHPPIVLSAEETNMKVQCELLTAYVSSNQEKWRKGLTALSVVRADIKHAHPIAEISLLARDYARNMLSDRSQMVMIVVNSSEIKRGEDRLEAMNVLNVFMRADY